METDTQNTFLARLQKMVADRGSRAALRRYWSPATRHQAYPLLGQLGALKDDRKTILAALYAEHPEHQAGQSVGKAALRLGERKDGNHPYDSHFRRLLACDDLDDLAKQLHRLVKRLQREGIALDYEELHKNLNYWANYSENVKVDWAAGFWQAPMAPKQTEAAEV
ncbi:MAG: type I-E CRISPR-associated protein Cse2/CasB [Puniceicoccaceae bacterium]|nr:type I-E CRISPR-associated protein Cse2/CasB [Puniceicoccaceae bacterium]|tara:strand:- start:12424 stop:12921 length:498 start_codon:yes stop_codon:yes gene_type:complete